MASANSVLTIWEIVRLWAGGGEYREKRIPELVANLVSGSQDDNAVAGALSDWFRNNFVNENDTALLFTVARFLRARGGRKLSMVAEVIEALPDISEEMRRRPEMQSGTPEERQAYLKEAMATAVAEKYEAVKAGFSTTHTPGGPVSDTNPATPTGSGWGEKLSAMFGGLGEGLDGMAENLAGVAVTGFQFITFWLGLSILYLLLTLLVTFAFPSWMPAFAWLSFAGLVGIPAITMAGSVVVGRIGAVIQAAASFLLAYFSSSLLVIVFALAAICTIATGEEHFAILCMGMIVVIVWDRIVVGLTQKALGLPGFFTKGVAAISDGKVTAEEAAGLADHWKNNTSLVVISVTVAGAVNVGWTVISIVAIFQHPTYFPLCVAFIAAQVVLGGAYVRMGLKLARESEYGKHLGLEAHVKKWSGRLYTGSMVTTVAAPLLAVLLIVGFFVLPWEGVVNSLPPLQKTGTEDQGSSTAGASTAPTPKETSKPGTKNCNGKQVSVSKVRKDLAALNAAVGGSYCSGGMTTYPCNCE